MKQKTWQRWTPEEIELLTYHWQSSTMVELMAQFPNRKYPSLMLKAREIGVVSKVKRKRKGSLKFLDELTPQSCYWWGFIMADGHITQDGSLCVSITSKDASHVEKLANHLHTGTKIRTANTNSYTNKPYESCELRIMDAEFGKKWLGILEIRDKKTYVPPNLDIFFDKERLVYFFIGLVDGDGCIWLRKKRWIHLKIEIHVNWLPVLQKLSIALKELYGIESKVSVSKKNTAVMQINGVENFRLLQSFLIGIDFMERKWDQIQSTIEI